MYLKTEGQDLRRPALEKIMELAEMDESIVFITCDVGFSFLEEFQQKFPNRFYNFGVTEQSSMLIAAGMALSGLKPYIYSMINFMVFRPYEMVRNGIGYHNANVKILGVKGSEKYKFLGFSHNLGYEDEDIHVLTGIPEICAFAPKTPEEVQRVIQETYISKNPTYIRL